MDANFENFLSEVEGAIGLTVCSHGILKLREVYERESQRIRERYLFEILNKGEDHGREKNTNE